MLRRKKSRTPDPRDSVRAAAGGDLTLAREGSVVDVGSIVLVEDPAGNRCCLVVVPDGSPISPDTVTVSSPTGRALLGHGPGDTVRGTLLGALLVREVVHR